MGGLGGEPGGSVNSVASCSWVDGTFGVRGEEPMKAKRVGNDQLENRSAANPH